MNNFARLQSALGVRFRNPQLLKQAFTHASYVNEQRLGSHQDNERLEYLGDAVLELAVSEYLYHMYPTRPEGELTKMRASIVCEPSLVSFAEQLKFGEYVLLGKGEEITGGRTRPSLLADVFEAFVGALYLDQGLEAVKSFLREHVFSKLADPEKHVVTDYKTRLQEYAQHHNLGVLEYQIVAERGPAHDREFVAVVRLDGAEQGKGIGRSKKEAEQHAAAEALGNLNATINP